MVKLVIWNFIQTRSILLGGVLEPSPTPCETQTSARQRTEIFSYQNWSFETFSCPLNTSGWRPGAISIPFWELVFLMPQLLCNWSKNGGKAFWKKFKTGKYLKDSFKTQGFDEKPSVFWRLQASVTLHKIAHKIAWEYPLSKRGLWDFEQHSDFICHWQKTRNWQKKHWKIDSTFTKISKLILRFTEITKLNSKFTKISKLNSKCIVQRGWNQKRVY